MNFEQIIRPFQSPTAISTRTIVTSKSTDTSDPPTITWGSAGTIPSGSKQPDDGINFSVLCCDDTWVQKGAPITEDVHVPIKDTSGAETGDYVVVKRVKQVKMKDSKKGGCEDSLISKSYVASYVQTDLNQFDTGFQASKACNATYKYNWT